MHCKCIKKMHLCLGLGIAIKANVVFLYMHRMRPQHAAKQCNATSGRLSYNFCKGLFLPI